MPYTLGSPLLDMMGVRGHYTSAMQKEETSVLPASSS